MVLHTKKRKPQSRCQCSASCKAPPLDNSPFCAKHSKFCPRRSPMTGSEPDFNPDLYNKNKGLKEALNCFAYGFDYKHLPKKSYCTKDSCPLPFPQPGRASGYPKWSKVNGKRCPDLTARLFGDVPDLKTTTFEKRCPKKYSKIALVVDEDEDYHFYRQDSNGFWSHKPGATDVTHLDATKRPIYDPQLASRHYPDSGLNYDQFCGYLCAPKTRKLHFKRGGKRNEHKYNNYKKTRKSNKKLVGGGGCDKESPIDNFLTYLYFKIQNIMRKYEATQPEEYRLTWMFDVHKTQKNPSSCNLWAWTKEHTTGGKTQEENDTHIDIFYTQEKQFGIAFKYKHNPKENIRITERIDINTYFTLSDEEFEKRINELANIIASFIIQKYNSWYKHYLLLNRLEEAKKVRNSKVN